MSKKRKTVKKIQKKNELHAPITAHCACSLKTLNQIKGDDAISKHINVQFVETRNP